MNLIKYFFSDQFVIDEKPEVVYNENIKTTGGVFSEDSADFFTQVSKLLVDRENLQSKMNELKSWTRSSDELLTFVKSLLPFLDAYDFVLESARNFPVSEELTNWLKNVEGLYFRMMKTLETAGLQPLKTIGKVVDLNIHDVVEYRPSMDYSHNTVIKERQKGYIFRGRLLRDAKVVVAYNERSVNKK